MHRSRVDADICLSQFGRCILGIEALTAPIAPAPAERLFAPYGSFLSTHKFSGPLARTYICYHHKGPVLLVRSTLCLRFCMSMPPRAIHATKSRSVSTLEPCCQTDQIKTGRNNAMAPIVTRQMILQWNKISRKMGQRDNRVFMQRNTVVSCGIVRSRTSVGTGT